MPKPPFFCAESGSGGLIYNFCEGIYKMTPRERFEKTAVSIASLNRSQLKSSIRNFKGRFRLDFTVSYLDSLPVDRLRHILLAAVVSTSMRN